MAVRRHTLAAEAQPMMMEGRPVAEAVVPVPELTATVCAEARRLDELAKIAEALKSTRLGIANGSEETLLLPSLTIRYGESGPAATIDPNVTEVDPQNLLQMLEPFAAGVQRQLDYHFDRLQEALSGVYQSCITPPPPPTGPPIVGRERRIGAPEV